MNIEEQDKYNFLTWYKNASFEDIRLAMFINADKFQEFIDKYEDEVAEIDKSGLL